MTNHIRRLQLTHLVKDPTLAQVYLSVYPEQLVSRTEVRGYLTGPRCAYSTTVEVAYSWREHARTYEKEGEPHITSRMIIPEPSLWEPSTPFLYEGPVELWENSQQSDRLAIMRGLREILVNPKGWRLNGQPFTVRGVARKHFSPEDLPPLRQAGFNTLLTSLGPDSVDLWTAADRLGFFMLGWISGRDSLQYLKPLHEHPSLLGYIVAAETEELEVVEVLAPLSFPAGEDARLGYELSHLPVGPLPEACRFILCDQPLLPDLAGMPVPKLIRLHQATLNEAASRELLALPSVVGWVLDPTP